MRCDAVIDNLYCANLSGAIDPAEFRSIGTAGHKIHCIAEASLITFVIF